MDTYFGEMDNYDKNNILSKLRTMWSWHILGSGSAIQIIYNSIQVNWAGYSIVEGEPIVANIYKHFLHNGSTTLQKCNEACIE
jgi:hypothetical protein